MPLSMEVNLGPCDVVLDGVAAPRPPKKGAQPPVFGSCLLWPNGWMDEDATLYGSRPRPRPYCIRREPSSPTKGAQQPPSFGPCLLWPYSPISATAELLFQGLPGFLVMLLRFQLMVCFGILQSSTLSTCPSTQSSFYNYLFSFCESGSFPDIYIAHFVTPLDSQQPSLKLVVRGF